MFWKKKEDLVNACAYAADTIDAFLIAHYNVDEEEEEYCEFVKSGRIDEMYEVVLPLLRDVLDRPTTWSRKEK